MRKYAATGLVLALLLSLLGLVARAQDSRPRRVDAAAPEQENADETVSIEGSLVEVPVVVADRSGRYVADLRVDDFVLSENGRPQRIAYFRSERLPLHVALLLDTSSSTRDSLGDIQDAAVEFVDGLRQDDEVMVVSFNNEVKVMQDFTGDRKKLAKAIKKTKTEQGTKLYDAVRSTIADRMRHVRGRKAVILLSDGDDTRSDASFEDAISASVESDVMVFGLKYPGSMGGGFNWPGRSGGKHKDKGWHLPGLPKIPHIPGVRWPLVGQGATQWAPGRDDFMETVAAATGGSVHYANTVGDMRGLFREIAEELSHVYVLGYSPDDPRRDGGYRSITVEVPSRTGVAVRHRPGYVAA